MGFIVLEKGTRRYSLANKIMKTNIKFIVIISECHDGKEDIGEAKG